MRVFVWMMVLILAGCARTTRIETRHQVETDAGPASHILLAARTPEENKRSEWENECAAILKRSGLKVTRSHKVLPDWQDPGSEALEDWARRRGADAVLLADITGLLLSRPYMPEEDPATGEPEMQLQWTFYPGGEKPETEDDPVEEEIRVQWIAPDGQRHWAGTARTHDARELETVARSQCKALDKTLTELGLLPGAR